jgi:DNA (cytosine-5)-methyltransferase 1
MIRVFEAFAGYGSQRMALRNLGIDFEVVGISEIVEDVLLSYAAIHTDFLQKKEHINDFVKESREEIIKELECLNVPLDYKTFENRAKKMKDSKLKEFFLANRLIHNYGDITRIDPNILPDFDLFTYSFPCQDISVAGYQNGLTEGAGTRSSLLWECCKIIETKRPRYLMMENVKNLVGSNHMHNFKKFINYLENLGYRNFWAVLNAKNYGVPQNRERVFCISSLDPDFQFKFPTPIKLKCNLCDMLECDVSDDFYLKRDAVLEEPINQQVSYCIDSNYWKGSTLDNFLQKHRRQLVSDRLDKQGKYRVRRLTPRETWRLMGCADDDFEKAAKAVSNTSLYKQAGNSIVVPVLEGIFRSLFMGQNKADTDEVQELHQFNLF